MFDKLLEAALSASKNVGYKDMGMMVTIPENSIVKVLNKNGSLYGKVRAYKVGSVENAMNESFLAIEISGKGTKWLSADKYDFQVVEGKIPDGTDDEAQTIKKLMEDAEAKEVKEDEKKCDKEEDCDKGVDESKVNEIKDDEDEEIVDEPVEDEAMEDAEGEEALPDDLADVDVEDESGSVSDMGNQLEETPDVSAEVDIVDEAPVDDMAPDAIQARTDKANPEEKAMGLKLAQILMLKPNKMKRYNTTWGDKTPIGLIRTVRNILDGGSPEA